MRALAFVFEFLVLFVPCRMSAPSSSWQGGSPRGRLAHNPQERERFRSPTLHPRMAPPSGDKKVLDQLYETMTKVLNGPDDEDSDWYWEEDDKGQQHKVHFIDFEGKKIPGKEDKEKIRKCLAGDRIPEEKWAPGRLHGSTCAAGCCPSKRRSNT